MTYVLRTIILSKAQHFVRNDLTLMEQCILSNRPDDLCKVLMNATAASLKELDIWMLQLTLVWRQPRPLTHSSCKETRS